MKQVVKVVSLSALVLAACALPAFAGRPIPTPEPVSMVLLGAGIAGVAVVRRLRK
jgi:PEP-CTERM motif